MAGDNGCAGRAIAIAVLAGIGFPLVRGSLAPLGRIEATAAAIGGGDLSRRIDHPSRGTEVGRLAGALDTMLGRIEAAWRARAEGEPGVLRSEDRMRQFVADAGHEPRTPLTSVRGLAEFGLQQGDAAGPDELLRLMSLILWCGARLLDRSGSADVAWGLRRLASSVRDLLGRLPAHALPARLPDATDPARDIERRRTAGAAA